MKFLSSTKVYPDSFPRSINHSTDGQLPVWFGFQRTLSVLLYLQFCICNLWNLEKDTKLVSFVFMQDQRFHNYRKLRPTYNTKEEGYLSSSHILRRNCLLKLVIEQKIEERTEVTIRRRRRNKLLNDLTEKRWSKLRGEALNRTLCRTQFVGGYGQVVSQVRGYTKAHRSRVYLTQNYPQDITWQNACDVLYTPRVTAGIEAN